ncbi:dihydrodipicolinate synthase family protein [Roseovarius pelagicus]|uniref:Dihydrodipicolinate synthase family protein n=1 Tax=Roseovarius pelagicus TaxID=2980108 RepID=A0ABY6D9E9_9RHOB|nr:dihydrodipicolinate synthase family protein [Roseovarius pelagicus]UXX82772.1 dihydrodipicolinate synthase family protein [Roseovarius pelagicus]
MSRLTEDARGVYVIAATPFQEDGTLDFDSTDRMVDTYLEKGAAGLTVLGMMGEATKLTPDEARRFVQHFLTRVDGRIPVVVGVSSPGFAQMQELTKTVMGDGAGGVMIAPPSTLKTDDQIVNYYNQAVEFIGDTPFVLQDFPLVTNIHMSVSVIARIIRSLPSCVCLKHEDWPGLEKISTLREQGVLDRRISILCGNGGLFLPEEMARGADGAMTGFCCPEMMFDVVREMEAGNTERAYDVLNAYLPLMRYEQQPGLGLAVRKYVMAKRGVIASDTLRQPGARLGVTARAEIDQLLRRQGERLAELG